jgi:UPF0755 protein
VAVLVVIAAIAILTSLPVRARQTFGPPAPGLSDARRFVLSAQLLWQQNDLTHPLDPAGTPRAFSVGMGEPTTSIVERLHQDGLIANAGAFRNFLKYSGLDTTIQAGEYTLSPAMTAVEIARALQDATPQEVTFGVLAGWRLEEIAASLPASGLTISPEEFTDAALHHPSFFVAIPDLPEGTSCEGFLFPDTYQLPRTTTANQLVTTLMERFDKQVTAELRTTFSNQGLTMYEAITLASIVQREAVLETEMPRIASVFLNRLAAGMKLDSDPTVQYAIGYNDHQSRWWTNPLSLSDLSFDSPYNTYLFNGLPPGPISNPSLSALRAVADPETTDYYYFRAACDGSGQHNFARTYEEHKANACP